MKIEIEKVDALVSQADKIMLSPDGEQVLIELLDMREQIELAINLAKERIKKAALELSPNFKSIQSDRLRVSYRSYGSRFAITDESKVPEPLLKKEIKVTLDTPALEKYIEESGMPEGVEEVDRSKTISIELKKPKEIEDGPTTTQALP